MDIRRRLKETVRTAAKAGFAGADVLYRHPPGPRILIYHQIGSGLGRQMEVTARAFADQIAWLAANSSVVDLDKALAGSGASDAHRMAVLTFDDGYDDMYRNAFPILRSAAMPFVLYLTTHPIESGEPLTPGGGANPLTWDQVNEMLDSGLATIGAHTHTHVELRSCDEAAIEEELEVSDRLIEQRTGVRARHFAYPWGYWSSVAHPLIAGRYQTAALGAGAAIGPGTDPLQINRVPVQLGDGVFFFKRKMRTGMLLEDRVRRRLARYDGP